MTLLFCAGCCGGEVLQRQPLPEHPKPGDEWISPHGIAFCWCPPGKAAITDAAGRREVLFARGFWMAKFETTCGQARAIDRGVRRRSAEAGGNVNDSNEPLTGFDFDAFQKLLNMLNGAAPKKAELARTEKDKIAKGKSGPAASEKAQPENNISEKPAEFAPQGWEFALPSEAEWEYGCRAGSTTAYHFGEDSAELPQYGNFADKTLFDAKEGCRYAHRTWDDGAAKLANAGNYKANAWGLHDMHGNVWEICDNLVARGGAWCSIAEYCRADFRHDEYCGQKRLTRPWLGYRLLLRRANAEQ